MKKEKTVRTYQRRTKSGKIVMVHEHKASYDAAEEARKAVANKKGAGSELEAKKSSGKFTNPDDFPISREDYKAWYHWDYDNDPNNETALRVEKALKKHLGKKGYQKYFDEASDSYSSRGHLKAYKALVDAHTERVKKQDSESSKDVKGIVRENIRKTNDVSSFERRRKDSQKEITNYFGTKADLENAAKKLDFSLKSKGFYAKVAGCDIEVYRQGDRPSMKNLQAAIYSKDYVSWGKNENNVGLRNSVESAIKEALSSPKKEEVKSSSTKTSQKYKIDYSKRKSTWANLDALRRDPRLSQAVHFDRMIADLSKKSAVRQLPGNMERYYRSILGGREYSETTARNVLSAMPQKYYKKYLEDFNADGGSDMRLWKYGRRW